MKNTFQDKQAKQTILQHGISVWINFKQLYQFLDSNEDYYSKPLPNWIFQFKDKLLPILKENISDIKEYLIYHDCGKPLCLSEDNNGQHFPNHAEKSKLTYYSITHNKRIADLIGDDMLCHTTKPKDFETLLDNQNIEILLCSALAEMHSNAQMFGGFDSDSFKIKFKNLDKLGKRILEQKYLTTELTNKRKL